jgi:hypothetical protein
MGLFKVNNEGIDHPGHSPEKCLYGSRIVNLLDGMIAN